MFRGGKGWVALEQSIGGLTGVCQHFHIGGEVCQRELRQTMLPLPEEVTGPPELQVLSATSKPELVRHMVRSRTRASGLWESEIKIQVEATFPRPTRPRSWCS